MSSTMISTPTSSMTVSNSESDRNPSKWWARLKSLAAPAKSPAGNTKLTGGHLIAAVIALNFVNGVAFVDILGIGVIQSAISDRYKGKDAVDWNTTSALIGATVGQCVLGYLSDVFTRRKMLLSALTLLFFGALGCAGSSWVEYPEMLVIFRAICGMATGSISNLVNISQNDFCTQEQRLNLQGVQGTSVALGSIIGSLAGALLPHWRYLYFMECGLSTLGLVATYKFVPPNRSMPSEFEIRKEVRRIDYLGIFTGVGWLVPGLLLLSKWRKFSTGVLVALSITAASMKVLFFLLGLRKESPDSALAPRSRLRRPYYRRSRPIAPFRLFKNRTVAAIYFQNILFGAAYYSFIYFAPVLAQVVRQESALDGVKCLVPYFVTHAVWSTASARVIKYRQERKKKSYSIVMGFGFACWTIAMALLGWDCADKSSKHFYIFAVLVGLGTGSVFQNSVLAITKQVAKDDGAVALGTRNVLRFLGGAIGTAMSSMIMRTVMQQHLPADLDWVANSAVADHSFYKRLTEAEEVLVRAANARGIMMVWYTFTGVLAGCLLLCMLIKDEGEKKVEDAEKQTPSVDVVTPVSSYASRDASSNALVETAESSGQLPSKTARAFLKIGF
ncbi:hypothetical protein DOTSEDRAFT_54617 [Dothistroma septosporum NZE10]|uniref:Major facilitator superfamily (MFS) profile domain-containing protein n=1 Tax=Dothistroma septosporum (strain NZE10 / CBS 128990) TaxID=675120 RepID=N1PLN3_DOTSN|nr:hypothetical protein DOTSEDRAFT_54617 [Dothistroma septosporum NZE10]